MLTDKKEGIPGRRGWFFELQIRYWAKTIPRLRNAPGALRGRLHHSPVGNLVLDSIASALASVRNGLSALAPPGEHPGKDIARLRRDIETLRRGIAALGDSKRTKMPVRVSALTANTKDRISLTVGTAAARIFQLKRDAEALWGDAKASGLALPPLPPRTFVLESWSDLRQGIASLDSLLWGIRRELARKRSDPPPTPPDRLMRE
jgi:hypothetical protein